MLLKTQRNTLFQSIQESGLSSDLFQELQTNDVYVLGVKGTSYQFIIAEGNPFPYEIKMRPGYYKDTHKDTRQCALWSEVADTFGSWVLRLNEELEAPDLWNEAAKTAQLFAPTAQPADIKFIRTELAEVQGQLRLLQLSFAQAALPEAARKKLIELTATAAEKAESFTKKDWQSWFIGSLVSSITALALNPTQAHDVYLLVKAAFGGLFLN